MCSRPGKDQLNLRGYIWDGFAAQIRSVQEYYDRSMQLLDPAIRADLFTPERPIWAKGADKSSTYVGVDGRCVDSLVAEGCDIQGTVENSVLFPGVVVEEGAEVRGCVLFKETVVRQRRQALLHHHGQGCGGPAGPDPDGTPDLSHCGGQGQRGVRRLRRACTGIRQMDLPGGMRPGGEERSRLHENSICNQRGGPFLQDRRTGGRGRVSAAGLGGGGRGRGRGAAAVSEGEGALRRSAVF